MLQTKIVLALKSRTFWTIAAMFVVGGLSSIEQALPGSAQTIVEGILALMAAYFHVNPSQTYKPE